MNRDRQVEMGVVQSVERGGMIAHVKLPGRNNTVRVPFTNPVGKGDILPVAIVHRDRQRRVGLAPKRQFRKYESSAAWPIFGEWLCKSHDSGGNRWVTEGPADNDAIAGTEKQIRIYEQTSGVWSSISWTDIANILCVGGYFYVVVMRSGETKYRVYKCREIADTDAHDPENLYAMEWQIINEVGGTFRTLNNYHWYDAEHSLHVTADGKYLFGMMYRQYGGIYAYSLWKIRLSDNTLVGGLPENSGDLQLHIDDSNYTYEFPGVPKFIVLNDTHILIPIITRTTSDTSIIVKNRFLEAVKTDVNDEKILELYYNNFLPQAGVLPCPLMLSDGEGGYIPDDPAWSEGTQFPYYYGGEIHLLSDGTSISFDVQIEVCGKGCEACYDGAAFGDAQQTFVNYGCSSTHDNFQGYEVRGGIGGSSTYTGAATFLQCRTALTHDLLFTRKPNFAAGPYTEGFIEHPYLMYQSSLYTTRKDVEYDSIGNVQSGSARVGWYCQGSEHIPSASGSTEDLGVCYGISSHDTHLKKYLCADGSSVWDTDTTLILGNASFSEEAEGSVEVGAGDDAWSPPLEWVTASASWSGAISNDYDIVGRVFTPPPNGWRACYFPDYKKLVCPPCSDTELTAGDTSSYSDRASAQDPWLPEPPFDWSSGIAYMTSTWDWASSSESSIPNSPKVKIPIYDYDAGTETFITTAHDYCNVKDVLMCGLGKYLFVAIQDETQSSYYSCYWYDMSDNSLVKSAGGIFPKAVMEHIMSARGAVYMAYKNQLGSALLTKYT